MNNSKTTERDIEFQDTGPGNQIKLRIKPRGKVIKQNNNNYKKVRKIMAI